MPAARGRCRRGMSLAPLVEAIGLEKRYRLGRTEVPALRGVDLRLEPGEFVVVAGPSGSGKSTLLNLLGCLDDPDAGSVVVEGRDVSTDERVREDAPAASAARLRVPVVPPRAGAVRLRERRVPAADRRRSPPGTPGSDDGRPSRPWGSRTALGHRPDQLSGGERQRVAVARALVHDPVLVLADEPTANLDSATGGAVVDLLARLNAERHVSFLLATHDPAIMRRAPRVVRLADGRVVEDGAGRSALMLARIALRNLARNRRRTLLASARGGGRRGVAPAHGRASCGSRSTGLREAFIRGGLGHLEVAPAAALEQQADRTGPPAFRAGRRRAARSRRVAARDRRDGRDRAAGARLEGRAQRPVRGRRPRAGPRGTDGPRGPAALRARARRRAARRGGGRGARRSRARPLARGEPKATSSR